MAQGYTGYNIIENKFTIKDSANLDAFSRLRVSNPLTIFSNQFTYDASPLIFEEVTNNSLQTDLKYDSTNKLLKPQIKPGSLAGNYVYAQSYEYIPYQPGRSQLVFLTFNFVPPSVPYTFGASTKRIGLCDGNNGFELEFDATGTLNFIIRTTTSAGTQIVDQPNWNLDRLDGTGPSGITLQVSKVQILVIDFQALYVGRVRMGFDIDGEIVYAHEFLNANNTLGFPYIATANLPIRVGIESTGSGVDDEFQFICASVASEGGTEDSQRFGYDFVVSREFLAVPLTSTCLMSLRPKTLFQASSNRVKFQLKQIEISNTGNKPFYWELGVGGSVTGAAYTNVNTTYSAMEYDVTGGAPTTALAVAFDGGYVPSAGGSRASGASESITSKYPITLNAAGANRDLGTLRLFGQSLGGSTDVYVTLKWKEIR